MTNRGRGSRLDDALAPHVASGQVPGLVAAVRRGGREEVVVLGVKTAGGNDAVRRDTLFRIASISKPITAAATMILVDQGKLRIDDPVDHWLPELAHPRVLERLDGPLDRTTPARRAITVRDLLTFRMGTGLVFAPPGSYPIQRATDEGRLGQGPPSPATPPPPDEWIRRLGALPLIHQPGESWMYNTSADVLGVLVARASGQPFDAFLRQRLFAPLGMKDTDFHAPPAKIDRLATSYAVDPHTHALTIYDPRDGQWSRPPAFPSGAGGLVSTLDDLLAFGQMMLEGGRPVLSAASVAAMTTDHLTAEQKRTAAFVPGFFDRRGWGFGMAVVTAQDELGRPAGTFGWDGGLGTSWATDPRNGLVGVLLTQQAWTSPVPPEVYRDFWRSAYQGGSGLV
jgi:CubicO group peptidase (beta-lactamase class C family)